jgi:phage regulator Rha-like protein
MNDNTSLTKLATSSEISMTSKEIAELVGKRHDNVKRTVETLIEQGVITYPQIEDGIKSANGVVEKLYVFSGEQGKRDSIVVVAQLSPKFTAALVDRWQELEKQVIEPKLPQTYIDALKALVASEEAKLALSQENAILNTIIDNEFGYCSILRASQHLGVHEKTFNWRPLKEATRELGLSIKKVPSPRYEYQNLYPLQAFEQCYPQFDFSGIKPEVLSQQAKQLAGPAASPLLQ